MHANIGVEKYFFAAGDQILNRIKEVAEHVDPAGLTGPIADVLYSAAGTAPTALVQPRRDRVQLRGRSGPVLASLGGCGCPGDRDPDEPGTTGYQYLKPGDVLRIDTLGTPETRTVAIFLPAEPRVRVPKSSSPSRSGPRTPSTREPRAPTLQTASAPAGLRHRGQVRGAQFSAGNYGLLESALEFAQDKKPPKVEMTGPPRQGPITTTFST